MKKIIALITILASALVAKAEFTYNNGLFTVVNEGNLDIYMKRDYGGSKDFGYFTYNTETKTRGELVSMKITQGQSFSIENLSAGTVIGFYTLHAGQGIIYSDAYGKKDTLNMTFAGMDTAMEGEVYNLKWNANRNGVQISVHGSNRSAPSGQPLPGILATVLLVGGVFSFLRRKRK